MIHSIKSAIKPYLPAVNFDALNSGKEALERLIVYSNHRTTKCFGDAIDILLEASLPMHTQ